MNLKDLSAPFSEEQIEWRIARCGKKKDGSIWAKCLVYVSARAIMDRLDQVCGPENWTVEYRFIPASQETIPGVIATIGIKTISGTTEGWTLKEDGADQTDVEAFKGGISSALKRAGVVWGIGRYLYGLEEGFVTIVQHGTTGARYTRDKEVGEFYWIPPKLPAWALPKASEVSKETTSITQIQSHSTSIYRIQVGSRWIGKTLEEVGPDNLRKMVAFLDKREREEVGYKLTDEEHDFRERAMTYISSFENEPGSSE